MLINYLHIYLQKYLIINNNNNERRLFIKKKRWKKYQNPNSTYFNLLRKNVEIET